MSDFEIIPLPDPQQRRGKDGRYTPLVIALTKNLGRAVKLPPSNYADMQRMANAIANRVKADGLRFHRMKLQDGSFAVWLEKLP